MDDHRQVEAQNAGLSLNRRPPTREPSPARCRHGCQRRQSVPALHLDHPCGAPGQDRLGPAALHRKRHRWEGSPRASLLLFRLLLLLLLLLFLFRLLLLLLLLLLFRLLLLLLLLFLFLLLLLLLLLLASNSL